MQKLGLVGIYKEQKKQYYEAGCHHDRFNMSYYYFYRPLSFFLSVPFSYFGISANTISISRTILFLGCLGAFIAGFNNIWLHLILLLTMVMDFSDGTVARYSGSSSNVGAFLDGLLDFFNYFIFLALPFLSKNTNSLILSFELELTIALLVVFMGCFFCFYDLRVHSAIKLSREKASTEIEDSKTLPGVTGNPLSIKSVIKGIYDFYIPMISFSYFFNTWSYILFLYLLVKWGHDLVRIVYLFVRYKDEL